MSEENPQGTEQAQTGQAVPVRKRKKGDGEDKPETLHLKTKSVPPVVMLSGGLFVTVGVFLQQLDLKRSLLTILVGLIVFLIVGDIVKLLLDRIEIPNPELVDADGNVIEKGKSEEDNAEGETGGGGEENAAVDGGTPSGSATEQGQA